jgi:hypothetical protein
MTDLIAWVVVLGGIAAAIATLTAGYYLLKELVSLIR